MTEIESVKPRTLLIRYLINPVFGASLTNELSAKFRTRVRRARGNDKDENNKGVHENNEEVQRDRIGDEWIVK